MSRLERAGWSIRQLFSRSPTRGDFEPPVGRELVTAVVCSLDPPRRSPSTPIEQRLASALNKATSLPFERLVKAVSDDLYEEELRKGAGVLDIGFFGNRLFHGDVIRALQAGDGILWEIRKTENQ